MIINDILDYSRSDAGKLVLHPESFDLQQVIHDIFQLMPPRAMRARRLKRNWDLLHLPARPDDRGIAGASAVLTNLIGHAVKLTDEGHCHRARRRCAAATPRPARVPIRVVVEEPASASHPRCRPMSSASSTRSSPRPSRRFYGTASGCRSTRKLVEMMGGEIWLESEPGWGRALVSASACGADPAARVAPATPLPEGRDEIW